MKIPEEKIEEIRSASDIVDVVSAHVRLKRRGKNFIGLCPFHQEKTPSFSVSPDKQMFYCFGCHEGGNVFTFVMKIEKVSFIEAVRSLAEKAGITLPTTESDTTAETENEQLYRANLLAARFFYESLTQTTEGEFALNYFRKRGFSDETIKQFGLGYAPRGWQSFLNHAKEKGLSEADVEKAGLAARRDDGSYYDRFRGRAVFPIFSTAGRVVAFAGRQLYDDDTLAKYINTPETPIYYKGKLLYGLSLTRDHIRRQEYAILVEGYTDLISMYQSGIQNIVATSGTALTEDQIRILGRYAPAVVIVYDADSAGSAAALRGVGLILEKGLDVRIAQLPHGEDPDSFVRAQGKDAFLELIDESVSFIDFKALILQREGYFATPEGQTKAVRSLMETLSKIPDELKRNFYIKDIAERYGIYESTLHRELEVFTSRDRRRPRQFEPADQPAFSGPANGEGNNRTPGQGHTETIPPADRDILKLLLESDREVIEYIFSQLAEDELQPAVSRELFTALLERYRQTGRIEASGLLNDERFGGFSGLISELLTVRYEISKYWESISGFEEIPVNLQLSVDAVRTIKKRSIKERVEEVRKKMHEVERQGGDSIALARELQILQREIKLIDKQYTSYHKSKES
jgi:DNA primase